MVKIDGNGEDCLRFGENVSDIKAKAQPNSIFLYKTIYLPSATHLAIYYLSIHKSYCILISLIWNPMEVNFIFIWSYLKLKRQGNIINIVIYIIEC